jgi:hypothetical protein
MARITGGKRLEAKLRELSQKVAKARVLKVGFLEGATYPDGTPVAMVAAIQEYGAPSRSIPPRPFFRPMVAKESPGWGGVLATQLKATNFDAGLSLERLGALIAGQLREGIIAIQDPPLSPITLMLRKMQYDDSSLIVTGRTVGEAAARVAAGDSYAGVPTKPLVWTGHLLQSVDFTVTAGAE